MYPTSPKNYSMQLPNSPKGRVHDCPTCQCQAQGLSFYKEQKPTNMQSLLRPISSTNQQFTHKKKLTLMGDNLKKDKILWFKSISPPPKKVIIKVISPQKSLNHKKSQSELYDTNQPRMAQSITVPSDQKIFSSQTTIGSPINKITRKRNRNYSDFNEILAQQGNQGTQQYSFGGNLQYQ